MGRLNAGALTERLSLRNLPTPTPDGQGGWNEGAPTEPTVVYASVRVLSGIEKINLGQTAASTVAEFRIRFRPSVTSDTEATWQGKTLGVRQVVHDPFREFTLLTCEDSGLA